MHVTGTKRGRNWASGSRMVLTLPLIECESWARFFNYSQSELLQHSSEKRSIVTYNYQHVQNSCCLICLWTYYAKLLQASYDRHKYYFSSRYFLLSVTV